MAYTNTIQIICLGKPFNSYVLHFKIRYVFMIKVYILNAFKKSHLKKIYMLTPCGFQH